MKEIKGVVWETGTEPKEQWKVRWGFKKDDGQQGSDSSGI